MDWNWRLEKYWVNALPIYDDRYIKIKVRTTYDVKVFSNFCVLNMSEDDIEYESFTVISVDYLFVYESKYYL